MIATATETATAVSCRAISKEFGTGDTVVKALSNIDLDIPRAEIYTSSDVTVEELRGEGGGPKLTAEALAERLGEPLAGEDDL